MLITNIVMVPIDLFFFQNKSPRTVTKGVGASPGEEGPSNNRRSTRSGVISSSQNSSDNQHFVHIVMISVGKYSQTC